MKLLVPWLLLVCLPASLLAEGAAAHSRSSEALILRFPYQPPQPNSPPLPSRMVGASDLVLLPQFTVTGSPLRLTKTAVEAQAMKRKAEAFTWDNGGTLLKFKGKRVTYELEFTPNGAPGQWKVLSVSW